MLTSIKIGYFSYLHFKCYSLSWFPLHYPLPHPTLSPYAFIEGAPPSTHPLLLHHPNISLCWGTLPSQVQEPLMPDKVLLHMQPEVWVPSCALFGTTLGALGGRGVLIGWYGSSSYGVAKPSALAVLPLTLPRGSLCSVWWLAASIYIGIRRKLHQVPVSKHFLASATVSGIGVCIWDVPPGGTISGWPFLQSLFHFFFLYFL
jgi:hypothetical protein